MSHSFWITTVTVILVVVLIDGGVSAPQYDGGFVQPDDGGATRHAVQQCRQISQVQQSLIAVLRTHYEHGASISALHTALETLAPEVVAVSRRADTLEAAQKETADKLTELLASRHNATAARRMLKLTGMSYREATAALSQPKAYYRPIPKTTTTTTPSGGKQAKQHADVAEALAAVQLALKSQADRIARSERKQRGLRRAINRVSDTVTQLAALHKSNTVDEASPKLLEHFIQKQTEINVNLLKRIRNLEDSPTTAAPKEEKKSRDGCPENFIRHMMSCYKFENTSVHWIDAEKACQQLNPNAHLACLETREEEQFIINYRNYNDVLWSSAYIWLGGTDTNKEGDWTWIGSGRPIKYSNWRPREPNNRNGEQHCIYLRPGGASHYWDDWNCSGARLNSVCEIRLKP